MGCGCSQENIDSKDIIYKDEDLTTRLEREFEKLKNQGNENLWVKEEEYFLKEDVIKEEKNILEEENNKEKEKLTEKDTGHKIEEEINFDSSNWREYIEDDNNFNQNIPFDFKTISSKLKKASENPENLNPFYTLSAIYDFTKFFKNISSALSMGFSDITEKCEIMRKRFKEYPDVESIQDLCSKEIELEIYKLNGDNNKSLGHSNDEYSTYISGCRTFLRLLWFLEYLIDVFETIMKDDGNGEIKKILGDSYNKVLAPHHGFFVRRAVGVALSFSNAGKVSDIVEIIFGYTEFNEETIKAIKNTNDLMKRIWGGGNEFYEKNKLLGLE